MLHLLRRDRMYERLDITALTGITDAQRGALPGLGAVDRETSPALPWPGTLSSGAML